jgi:uncharacterized OB-fold protein
MNEAHAGKRLPRPTALSAPYWEGCREGKLLIQRCTACGKHQFYPRNICTACTDGDLEWVASSGRGAIRSFTVIRHPVSRAYADEVPYALALVQLEEGPTMMSSLLDCDPDTVETGAAVEVAFEQWSEEITMPKFRLVK